MSCDPTTGNSCVQTVPPLTCDAGHRTPARDGYLRSGARLQLPPTQPTRATTATCAPARTPATASGRVHRRPDAGSRHVQPGRRRTSATASSSCDPASGRLQPRRSTATTATPAPTTPATPRRPPCRRVRPHQQHRGLQRSERLHRRRHLRRRASASARMSAGRGDLHAGHRNVCDGLASATRRPARAYCTPAQLRRRATRARPTRATLSTLGCQHVQLTGTCDDGNACTVGDTCVNGACLGAPTSRRPPAVTGNVCNGIETCDPGSGACLAGTPLDCDDGDACNGVETCDPVAGLREPRPARASTRRSARSTCIIDQIKGRPTGASPGSRLPRKLTKLAFAPGSKVQLASRAATRRPSSCSPRADNKLQRLSRWRRRASISTGSARPHAPADRPGAQRARRSIQGVKVQPALTARHSRAGTAGRDDDDERRAGCAERFSEGDFDDASEQVGAYRYRFARHAVRQLGGTCKDPRRR